MAGEPWRTALLDTFTITPPCPPCRVDMRLTASRAHNMGPSTFGQHALQALGRHLVEARGHVHNAGVVDQTGQRGQVGIGLQRV